MNAPKDAGPAFPQLFAESFGGELVTTARYGMTLRDWFAGQALNAIVSKRPPFVFEYGSEEQAAEFNATARGAYDYADAMLKARES